MAVNPGLLKRCEVDDRQPSAMLRLYLNSSDQITQRHVQKFQFYHSWTYTWRLRRHMDAKSQSASNYPPVDCVNCRHRSHNRFADMEAFGRAIRKVFINIVFLSQPWRWTTYLTVFLQQPTNCALCNIKPHDNLTQRLSSSSDTNRLPFTLCMTITTCHTW